MNREEYEEKYNEIHDKCINCQEWDNLCECIICQECDEPFMDLTTNILYCYDCRDNVLLSECCGAKALQTDLCPICNERADFS